MRNVFIINAHQPWPFSEGKLNRTMVEIAANHLQGKGCAIRTTTIQDGYDVEQEIQRHTWTSFSLS